MCIFIYENAASWTMTIITQGSCHSVVQVHDNVEAVKLYSKVDGGTLYFFPPFSLPSLSFSPFSPHHPLRRQKWPLKSSWEVCGQWRSQGLKGGYTKNRTYRRPFYERHTRDFGGESGGPPFLQKKIEFGIGGGAISACIDRSFAFFSLFLVDILSRSEFLHPTPPYFYANFDKLWNPYFKKWCNPRPPVAPPVLKERCKLSGGSGAEPTAVEIEFDAKP